MPYKENHFNFQEGFVFIDIPKYFKNDTTIMNNYIKTELGSLFQNVLITEHFDESLLLLKRKFCLNLEDILYIKMKHGSYIYKDINNRKALNEKYQKKRVSSTFKKITVGIQI